LWAELPISLIGASFLDKKRQAAILWADPAALAFFLEYGVELRIIVLRR
jgi:hypothetical protein